MAQQRKRYRLNVAGDFYVEDGCCTLCGVPASTAPELFGGFAADGSVADGVEECWVKRQTRSGAELDAMIATMARQELGCIRYAGSDPVIISRLHAIGESAQIDGAEGVGGSAADGVESAPPRETARASTPKRPPTAAASILAEHPHRLLLWSAIATSAVYILGDVAATPMLILLGPLVGTAIVGTIVIVARMIRWMPDMRPGAPPPLELASTERVDRVAETARDLMSRVLGMRYDECFISDESSLWDFHVYPSNDAYVERIRELYGVDVSDVTDGNLATILERIAIGWPANRPPTPPSGYAPRP
jgi:hypothetical protein